MTTGSALTLGLVGTGRTGRMVERVALARGHRIGLRLDADTNKDGVGLSPRALMSVDVLVDFSSARAVEANILGAAAARTDLVLGTTGWEREEGALARARSAAEEAGIGLVWSPNFSFGMHLFRRLVAEAARLADADPEIDLWIEETHHAGKADHPSGTAIALAETVLQRVRRKERVASTLPVGPVDPATLLVSASRGGHVPGEHRLVLDAPYDTIEMVHRARSRETFALGAVRAAEWVHGRKGFFTLDDILEEKGQGQSS